jgi:hypothetical protein
MGEASELRGTDVLTTCPACGCRDLFVRKDFPQRLGLGIVVVAAVAFLVLAANRATFYIGALVLVAAAGLDAVLYLMVRKITVCYRCGAEFRRAPLNPRHEGFELAVAEKYRAAGKTP